jgi:hypothetical protein
MISSVPAPIRFNRMSRHTRSTPYSFMYPAPPWIWMHSSATSTAMREAWSYAIEISRTGYSPLLNRHAVV